MEPYVSVIGGINLDLKGVPATALRPATSTPGTVHASAGGVGRNIAHNLALLGVPVTLFGVVGDDAPGRQLRDELQQAGVNIAHVRVLAAHRTGIYLSILDETHDLALAIAGMAITDELDPAYLARHSAVLRQSRLVVIETNVRVEVLAYVAALCAQTRTPCLIEPVSVEKSLKILDVPGRWDYMTPNVAELEALSGGPVRGLDDVPAACAQLAAKSRHLLVTLGAAGVYWHVAAGQSGRRYPSPPTAVVDSTGAGDAFVAGFVSGMVRDCADEICIRLGMAAAGLTLRSEQTVSPTLSHSRCYALAMT